MFIFQDIAAAIKKTDKSRKSTSSSDYIRDRKERKELSEIDHSAIELKNLFEKLNSINQAASGLKSVLENSWATGYGINKTLTGLLGSKVYFINPDLSSIESPVSGDDDEAFMGTVNYIKMIRGHYVNGQFNDGFIKGERGSLDKPIIMILNTGSIKVKDPTSSEQTGGVHWQACVILPRNYVTPFGKSINNLNEIVFFIDSKYENKAIPVLLKHILQNGFKYEFESEEGGRYVHLIPASMPDAIFPDCTNIPQQSGGSDCGWWAVYNALMFVFTGKRDFLDQFKKRSRDPAYSLRGLFNNLTEELRVDTRLKKEVISKKEQETIRQAIEASLKDTGYKPSSSAEKSKESAKKRIKKKGKLKKKKKDHNERFAETEKDKKLMGDSQKKLQPKHSPLEVELMQAVFEPKIDLKKVGEILKNLLDAEQYITIRDSAGRLFTGVIEEALDPWFSRKVTSVEQHNEMIDIQKRKRLHEIVDMIEKNQVLEHIKNYLDKNNLNEGDLTFLLTLMLSRSPLRLELLRFLLDKGADVNGLGISGHRPVYLAVHCGSLDALRILKQRGASLKLVDVEDRTLIFAALRKGRLDLVSSLVTEFGCDINDFDYYGKTPLHDTTMRGNSDGVKVVKILIKLGADPTAKNIFNETPLDNAVSGTHGFDILNSLFRPDYAKSEIRQSRSKIAEVLRIAMREKERIERIFSAIERQKGPDISLAHLDVQDKDMVLLRNILVKRSGVYSLNLSGNFLSFLEMAATIDYLRFNTWICQLILEDIELTSQQKKDLSEKLSPNQRLERFLSEYNSTEKMDILVNLVKYGANVEQVNNDGWFVFHCAAYHDHVNTISFLIKQGINIGRSIEEDGRTALHVAADIGKKKVVTVLLDFGAQHVDPIDHTGHTPLSIAVQKGHILVVKTLLSHGANPNHFVSSRSQKEGMQGYSGQSTLEIAVQGRKPKITKQLLKSGSKLTPKVLKLFYLIKSDSSTKKDEVQKILNWRLDQEKSLFTATLTNNQKEVEELLNNGVDIDCMDENGLTCLQYALQKKYWSLAAWFMFKGANYSGISEIDQLNGKEKQELHDYLSQFRLRHPKSTIYFLQSKTEYASKLTDKDFDVFSMYEDLFGRSKQDSFAQYTRPILQVVEHGLGLTIVYDPHKIDTRRANIHTMEGTQGNYSPTSHTIQIAGKTGSYEEVRGTVIHEFCHMACDLVWKNERNPYPPKTEQEKKFIDICLAIQEEYQNTKTRSNLDRIVQTVFNCGYEPDKHARELIVRVPQIIATHGFSRSLELCEISNGFKQLFDFYKDDVLPSFQRYVVDNQFKKLAYFQSEKSWDAFTVSRRVKASRVTKDTEAIKIQSFWKGNITRRTYRQIRFIQNYIEGLKTFLTSLGAENASKCLESELEPVILRILDDFTTDKNLLFSFRQSRMLVEKLGSFKESGGKITQSCRR